MKELKEDKSEQRLLKVIMQELNEDPCYKFKLVFGLISIIPFLVFFYIIYSTLPQKLFFSLSRSTILFLALFISIFGFWWGYTTIKNLFQRLIIYASKLKHSEQMKSELVASVTHDFKTPISILKASLSNISDSSTGQMNEIQKTRLESCRITLEHMLNTIDTLLDLYKVESGMATLKKEPVDLGNLLADKLKEFEMLIKEKSVELKKVISKHDLVALVDSHKISEVINNLLGNALKYTPQKGVIIIKAHSDNEFIRLEFENSGGALPTDKLTTIFEKFHRLNSLQEGTGLGLAIAKDIVEIHNGHIWAENSSKKYAKFVVILPRYKSKP